MLSALLRAKYKYFVDQIQKQKSRCPYNSRKSKKIYSLYHLKLDHTEVKFWGNCFFIIWVPHRANTKLASSPQAELSVKRKRQWLNQTVTEVSILVIPFN